MKFLRSRRGIAVVVALLLVLFLWRPGVYRLRSRIAGSIGSALGRSVAIDNVRLRLLPRPGFDLEGLVISDDPAFSAEPMIRAQEVSAAIRFRSLLRGHLEIATLSATEPSINLVRNSEGRWNLASLIERTAQIPSAPTAKPASERRPAFPYLEATNARVNFKIGQIKKSYALMDADVALWQDSENSWGARIKAAPVRTDFNLTDTGLVQIDATWQRAASLRLTPVEMTVQWQKGQLGQITQLFSGKDRGWRGGVSITAKLSGTGEGLHIDTGVVVDDFHRYDIVGSENVRLATVCSGRYDVVTKLLDQVCESPVGSGTIRVIGGVIFGTERLTQQTDYHLQVFATRVPLTSVARLLRQAKNQLPPDLTASGLLNGEFLLRNNYQGGLNSAINGQLECLPLWSGTGSATDVRLLSNAGSNEVTFGTIPFSLVGDSPCVSQRDRRSHARTQEQQNQQEPEQPHLKVGPSIVKVNGSAPLNAGGWVSSAGYDFFLRGDVELKNLFGLENVLGLPAARPAAEGDAHLDVRVSGPWQGFSPPVTLGTAQLRNVRAEMRGLNTPIEISSAAVTLIPEAVLIQKISARTGDTHWSGGVTAPRHCTPPGCVFQFDLSADQLSTDGLSQWFTSQSTKRPWYRILNSKETQGPSRLLALQARGTLHVGRFEVKKVTATQVATQVDIDRGKITLTSLRGQLFRGTHVGNWVIEVPTSNEAAKSGETSGLSYHGSGTLQNVSLEQVGAAMNDAWISGIGDGKFDWQGSGTSFRELLSTSSGSLQFVMRSGSLTHIGVPGAGGPLSVHRFAGDLRLEKGAWKLSDGKLESRDGLYTVSGTASAVSGFDFVLKRSDDQAWSLTGTLAKPHVVPMAQTEAKRSDADLKIAKP